MLNWPALEEEGGERYFVAVLSEESWPLPKAWMSQVWALSPAICLQNCLAYVGAQRWNICVTNKLKIKYFFQHFQQYCYFLPSYLILTFSYNDRIRYVKSSSDARLIHKIKMILASYVGNIPCAQTDNIKGYADLTSWVLHQYRA